MEEKEDIVEFNSGVLEEWGEMYNALNAKVIFSFGMDKKGNFFWCNSYPDNEVVSETLKMLSKRILENEDGKN